VLHLSELSDQLDVTLKCKPEGYHAACEQYPLVPDSADVTAAEFEVSQCCALRQHSCKALCPVWSDVIVAEIEVRQRWALPQHSF
jgi:hypothetical protein